MTRTRKRLLTALGVVAAVTAALAPGLSASAQESQKVKLSAGFPNLTLAPGTAGRSMNLMLWADVKEETTLDNFRYTIDASELNGVATVGPFGDMGCTTAGTVKTCDPFLDPMVMSTVTGTEILYVKPASGATVGQSGTLKLTISADNAITTTVTSKITIGEAVDLANAADVTVESQPGGSVTVPLGVRNAGKTAVRGVDLLIFQDYAAKLAKRYTNCEYGDEDAICHFDTTLEPGAEYALSEPLPIQIGKDAWAPSEMPLGGMWSTSADLEAWFSGVPQPKRERGTVGQLTLVTKRPSANARGLSQTDPRDHDNFSSIAIKVTGDNKADFAAVGDTARGEAGSVVTVDVGVKNLGPASASFRSGDPVQMVQIDVPDGTTAVGVSKDCAPYEGGNLAYDRAGQSGARRYLCRTDWRFPVGETISWEFRLRVDKKIDNATGTVTININHMEPANPDRDTNPANDTASLVINPVGGGNATLPVTGGKIAAIVGTAVALLTVGAVVFALARRRRTRFVVEG